MNGFNRIVANTFLAVTALLMAASLSACTLVITPEPASSQPAPALNPNGVIFTVEQTEASLIAIWPEPEGAWQPTAADIAKLEEDLPEFLKSAEDRHLRPDPPIWEREPEYMRQYLGIIEDGEQIIYANFFCTIHDIDWRNELVFVSDGGDCFFSVKYNPTSKEFFDLSVNGEA